MSRHSFVTERNQIFKNSQRNLRVRIASGLLFMGLLGELAEGGVIFEQLGQLPASSVDYRSSLIQASDGAFYGTTISGGLSYGTVYRATPEGTVTTIFEFPTNAVAPRAGLLQAADGYLYGTTSGGIDVTRDGTVFRISTNGEFTSLASLHVDVTGFQPFAPIIQGPDGLLYGTSSQSIFKTTTDGTLTLVALLPEIDPNPPSPPFYPNGNSCWAPVVLGSDGNFYSTANSGGDSNKGTIFRVTPNGTLTTLFSFDGPNGSGCTSPLIQATDGNFYGTSIAGGLDTNYNYFSPVAAYGYGTIFRITPSGTFTRLFSFDGTNGIAPASGVIQASDGNLYGTTIGGGVGMFPSGTVFQVTTNGAFTTLFTFASGIGGAPSRLMQARDGRLYGLTGNGFFFRLSVPMPPEVQPLVMEGKNVTLTWKSVAGQNYQVQSISDLSASNWASVTGVMTATNGVTSTTFGIGAAAQQFYRVVLLP